MNILALASKPLRRFTERGLSRNIGAAALQTVLGVAGQLLAYRALIAEEGLEAIGIWSMTVGVVSFARLGDLSGGAALSRFIPISESGSSKVKSSEYIDSVLIFTTAFYAAVGAIAWPYVGSALIPMMPSLEAEEVRLLLGLAIISLLLMTAATSQISAIDGLHRSDIRSVIVSVGWVIFLVLTLLIIPDLGVVGLAVAQIAQQAFVLIASRLVLVQHVQDLYFIPRGVTALALKETMGFGVRLQITSLSLLVFDPLSRIMIGWSGGMLILGVYELAYRFVAQARLLVGSSVAPLVPAFAANLTKGSEGAHKRADLLKRANVINSGASTVLLSGALIISPAVSIFFLDEIDLLFLTLVAAFVLASAFHMTAAPIYSLAQAVGVLRWNALGNIVMAGGAVLLIPFFSKVLGSTLSGIGVATGMAAGSLLAILGNCRYFSLPLGTIYPWRSLIAASGTLLLLTFALFAAVELLVH